VWVSSVTSLALVALLAQAHACLEPSYLLCFPLLDSQLMSSHPVCIGRLIGLAGTINLQVTWAQTWGRR
jgi:hypothetical protein